LEAAVSTLVTSKGQVTIPKKVREFLGIVPGDAVEFEIAPNHRVVLTKPGAERRPTPFARVRGSATAGMSTDAIMALTRGDA
jgi:antitoxin PrlF